VVQVKAWACELPATHEFAAVSLEYTLAERLLDFQYYWEAAAKPFEWKFSRQDWNELLAKLNAPR